jgi:Leucine-rich repeat (LRR) protein
LVFGLLAALFIVITLSSGALLAYAAEPDVVTFPDANLEAAVRDALSKPTGDITTIDMEGLTTLNAKGRSISDLSGLEHAVNLTYLNFYNNQITDISALSGLTNLTYLNFYNNQITDISALSGLTNLTELWLGRNQITDISVLSGLTSLTYLNLYNNQITDISALSGLTNLTNLNLYRNQITDISALSGLTSLTQLNLNQNQITDISALSGLTNLTELYLSYKQITDVGALSGLTNLTKLRLHSNQIADISALSGLTNLALLDLTSNQIADISALSGLTNLTELRLNSNQIADISALSGLTNLTYLNLNNNQITDIGPLVDNSGIDSGNYVDIRYNYLDLSAGSQDMSDIDTLIGRGAIVHYEPQNNRAPVLDSIGDQTVAENSELSFTITASDPDTNTLTLSASIGEIIDNSDGTWTWSYTPVDGPADSQTVTITADDGNGGTAEAFFELTVNNVAPDVGAITAPIDPVLIGTEIGATADFTDPGVLDTHTASWDWGDESTSTGEVTETNGSGSVSGSHSYDAAGVYTVKLTVTDNDGGSAESLFQYIVVYDPSAGFVTGVGWIDSPQGAYTADPAMTGKANFGFVSKYKKGATIPVGQTEFQFKAGDLNFNSSSYAWLVIAGSKAKYKGTGTVNGEGEYGFMLSAIDGKKADDGTDRFRIKIWDKSTDEVIYDNHLDAADDADPTTALGGGSIVVHKG